MSPDFDGLSSPPCWGRHLFGRQQGTATVVSVDHFRHELLAWLRRAAGEGASDVVITSGELCAAIRTGSRSSDACCDAMEAEIKPGDVIVVARSLGAGMTVRYLLSRPGQ
jgi:hypothetical protein